MRLLFDLGTRRQDNMQADWNWPTCFHFNLPPHYHHQLRSAIKRLIRGKGRTGVHNAPRSAWVKTAVFISIFPHTIITNCAARSSD
jgi:hypothetical protein